MFSGIVQGKFPARHVVHKASSLSYAVELPDALRVDLQRGASVAVDGVCQTVARLDGALAYFDVLQETLRVTTLSELREGALVHVERSLRAQQEIGGHAISGHVDTTVEIVDVIASGDSHTLTLRVPPEFAKYVFNKGFVALHGASLTVGAWDEGARTFNVYLIPETLRLTTLGQKKLGERLNLEIDRNTQVLVDTVERSVRAALSASLSSARRR